jgi:hypothetical protein
MRKAHPARRVIAVIAAYSIALQAFMPLASLAAAPLSAICASAATPAVPPPVTHDAGCACAAGCGMQCCGALALPTPDGDGIAAQFGLVPTRLSLRPAQQSPSSPRYAVQAPRPPPVVQA